MAGFWSSLFRSEEKVASARVAADRLKVIVATEQRLGNRLSPESIDTMKKEIMQVISRYIRGVNERDVQMTFRSEANIEMLEMNIELPEERL